MHYPACLRQSLRDCIPKQLQDSLTRLLNDHFQATPPGRARWALGLLADLAPLLDWKITLAHARFPDPTTPATSQA